MKGIDDRDIEKLLRTVALKPAPPGLRNKILETATRAKEEAAWTTPALRRCLACCAVILAAVFVSDAALSRGQQQRLQSVLGRDIEPAVNSERKKQASVDDLSDAIGTKDGHWRQWLLAHQKEPARRGRAVHAGQSFREESHGGEMAKDVD